jgi:hypothetical protein
LEDRDVYVDDNIKMGVTVVQRWATGWMIGGESPDRGWEFFSSPPCPDRLWGPPSLLLWVPGALSLGVKRPPFSAEVKNSWSYTSTPQYAFMAWYSVKAQGQLYFYDVVMWIKVAWGMVK